MQIYKNKDITTSIDTEKMSINNSDTYFYTEDKGSAALKIFINYRNAPFNLDNTNLIPILDLLHSDGSVWLDEPLEVITSEEGAIQYNIPNNVISHAGRVKAKLFLRNAEQSVHVANFTFDIKDSGIEGAVEKEISVNLVDDAVKRIMNEEIELYKGEKGDPFQYEDFTTEQLESLKGEKGDAFQHEDFTAEQLESLKGEKGDAFQYKDFTSEQLKKLKGEKGDAFKYEDFTSEQLKNLKGEKGDAFKYEDFTTEQLESLKGEKGDTTLAPPKIYTRDEYNQLETKDSNTLYFISEV